MAQVQFRHSAVSGLLFLHEDTSALKTTLAKCELHCTFSVYYFSFYFMCMYTVDDILSDVYLVHDIYIDQQMIGS